MAEGDSPPADDHRSLSLSELGPQKGPDHQRVVADQLELLLDGMEALAADIPLVDRSADLGALVTPADMRNAKIHRWFAYKEGFSPHLPGKLVNELGSGSSRTVADPFAGVGTTVLALREHPSVEQAIGVEYSPLAHFVAQTKLDSLELDPRKLSAHLDRMTPLPTSGPFGAVPALASFKNDEIFDQEDLKNLLRARRHVQCNADISEAERAFFLLGIAAVIEDVSHVMKDGRALRLLKGRARRKQGLHPAVGDIRSDSVAAVIANQWRAMVEDLASWRSGAPETSLTLIRGDARTIDRLVDDTNNRVIPNDSVGLHIYSPPYLNFIDYTEVYKLELWFLGLVQDQEGFRRVREGTLRSHPSITFPERTKAGDGAKVFAVIDTMTEFLKSNLSRSAVGVVPGYYFSDMYEALNAQFMTLEPAGYIACIVANSTLSRRRTVQDARFEEWRLPILTDVIIARMAEAAGFVDIEIWKVRSLQAKNVSAGFARESVVVARKPPC